MLGERALGDVCRQAPAGWWRVIQKEPHAKLNKGVTGDAKSDCWVQFVRKDGGVATVLNFRCKP